jgi:hypothetical protein
MNQKLLFDGPDDLVTRAVDAEWAMNDALAAFNAGDTCEFAANFKVYADSVRVHTAYGKLIVAAGLQAEYRQASIDRLNDYTRSIPAQTT